MSSPLMPLDSTQISPAEQSSNVVLEIIDGLSERIAPLIDTIAEQLGVASEFVFEILIRQAYVTGVTYLLLYIIGAILIYHAIKLWSKVAILPESDEADVVFVKALITTIIGSGLMICFMATIKETMTCLINPEFWALNYILDKL